MAKQLYYEDIFEGVEIPTLVKHPTMRQCVKWAGAASDWLELHYDQDYARKQGFPGVFVHGWLVFSFLSQMITNWIGDKGVVKKIGCSYRGMIFPGEDVICKGIVLKKYQEGADNLVQCEIWAEKTNGEKPVPGIVVVSLPSRKVSLAQNIHLDIHTQQIR